MPGTATSVAVAELSERIVRKDTVARISNRAPGACAGRLTSGSVRGLRSWPFRVGTMSVWPEPGHPACWTGRSHEPQETTLAVGCGSPLWVRSFGSSPGGFDGASIRTRREWRAGGAVHPSGWGARVGEERLGRATRRLRVACTQIRATLEHRSRSFGVERWDRGHGSSESWARECRGPITFGWNGPERRNPREPPAPDRTPRGSTRRGNRRPSGRQLPSNRSCPTTSARGREAGGPEAVQSSDCRRTGTVVDDLRVAHDIGCRSQTSREPLPSLPLSGGGTPARPGTVR